MTACTNMILVEAGSVARACADASSFERRGCPVGSRSMSRSPQKMRRVQTVCIAVFSLLCCCAFMMPSTAVADDQPALPGDGDPSTIDEIIVEAARSDAPLAKLPFAADVVVQSDIQDGRPLLGLDESLQGVPGLLLQNRYNFAQDLRISMRGFGARSAFGIRGIRIIVDGIPETVADGQGGVDGIDLGSARRIEVLRGGASAIYGNAGGGVILVSSERGGAVPELSFGAATGTDGYQRVNAKFKGQYDNLNVLLSGSELDYEGYREWSDATNRQLNMRLAYDAGDGRDWLFSAHLTDQPKANDPGGVNRAQYESDPRSARDANIAFAAGEALQQTRLGGRMRNAIGTNGELTVRGYYLDRSLDALLPFAGGGAIDLDRIFAGGGLRYRHRVELAGREHSIYAGIDYDRQDDDRLRFDNIAGQRGALTLDQNERVTSTGIYLQAEIALADTLALTLGLRDDRVTFDVTDAFIVDGDDSGSRTFSELSPLAGLFWTVNDTLGLYANASRSFESPTTTELANPSNGGGFNPDLESAIARQIEVGARMDFAQRHAVTAALFDIRVDDELIPFELATSPGRDFFANAGVSDRRGVELSWQATIDPQWRFNAAYTWSDFTFDTFTDDDGNVFDGNTVPGTAEHQMHVALNYRNAAAWYAGIEANYVDEIVLNNANSQNADDYTLVTLRGGAELDRGDWRLAPFISISNALGERYAANTRANAFGGRYFEAGPELAVFVGINITRRFAR